MEVWADVRGFEGLYQVSNYGNVRSLDRVQVLLNCHGGYTPRKDRGKLLTPTDNGNGYLIIGLKKGGKRHSKYVHRLVAEAFCDGERNGLVVNHKNMDKADNRAENLEWITTIENVRYSAERMRKPKRICKSSNTGEKYISLHSGRYRVQIKRQNRHISKEFLSLEEAVAFRDEVIFGARV